MSKQAITFEVAAHVGNGPVAEDTRQYWAEKIQTMQGTDIEVPSGPSQYMLDRVAEAQSKGWLWERAHNPIRGYSDGGFLPINSDTPAYNFLWCLYAEVHNDSTGQLANHAIEKYCATFSRQLHELKNVPMQDRPSNVPDWSYLADIDWSPASREFIPCNVSDELTIVIAGVRLVRIVRDGETFVGGFFTEQDKRRFRYSNKRLGAYLSSLGWSDPDVREFVEKDKMRNACAHFIVYPNDMRWSELYQNGVDSCMSKGRASYDSYDIDCDIHPVDVYSSARYGSGDNGLSLITTQGADGYVTGRGIYNKRTNEVVRWYGDHNARRALERIGICTADEALEGSWLALVSDGYKFVHPYVDGDISNGEVNRTDSRVYLVQYGDGFDLQDTTGCTYMGRTVYCEYQDERIPEDEATYLPYQDQYASERMRYEFSDCYVLDELCVTGEKEVLLDGIDPVIICGYAYRRLFNYGITLEGYQGYTNKEGEACIMRV